MHGYKNLAIFCGAILSDIYACSLPLIAIAMILLSYVAM